ncbi:uncharacterized protein LOC110883232 [Helianthus annuus]|uniref:uncharacterized protein LOC110883232 n=1 Tax=Helianthus annuus TaxID=4232 RepID=UPI000B8F0686|nr:uncharacterized protein LOC110883232 [Helianthus annuus]
MYPCKLSISGTWSKLIKSCKRFKVGGTSAPQMIRGIVGNGMDIKFWIDPWVSNTPLKVLFPNLFRLERNKWCSVADRLGGLYGNGPVSWSWRVYPSSPEQVADLISCHRMILGQCLVNRADTWAWYDSGPLDFSVNIAKHWAVSARVGSIIPSINFNWCKWIPLKCNVFMWRLLLDRIPTKVALRSRNIIHGEVSCGFCMLEKENVDHMFTACGMAAGLWQGIASWVKLPPIFLFSVKDIVEVVEGSRWSKNKKELLYGILIVACWRLWKARNERVFAQKNRNAVELVADIKSLSYLWLCSTGRFGGVDWKGWKSFVFDVM